MGKKLESKLEFEREVGAREVGALKWILLKRECEGETGLREAITEENEKWVS